jgi:hypothetical protein
MAKNKNLAGGLLTHSPLAARERLLSQMIAEYLDARRVYNDRLQCGAAMRDGRFIKLCKTGTPDRFAIVRGQVIFIEVKQPGAKPSPAQQSKHLELMAHGALVLICDSFDEFVWQFAAYRELIETRHARFLREDE